MATVTGITAAKAQENYDASVVGGEVVANDIVLIKGNTERVTIGRVAAFHSWPIGSIFFNVTATNPATLLGGGNWQRFGQGRMLVGVNEADTTFAFDAPLKSGGTVSTTLGIPQMPAHNHGGQTNIQNVQHSHAQNVSAANASGTGTRTDYTGDAGPGGAAAYQQGIYTEGESQHHVHAIGMEGGGQAFSNMSPYMTVYMWRRMS